MNVGMKIFGQIVSILPLALIVSLPNQLYGHVPITNISSQFTELLERLDAQEVRSNDEDESKKMKTPLPLIFQN
jgi:rRNA biogenesis protein RRP5